MTSWLFSYFLPDLHMLYGDGFTMALDNFFGKPKANFPTVTKGKKTMASMSIPAVAETTDQVGAVRASSPARLGNRMEYLYWEIPVSQAMRVMADIHDVVRTGVEDPSTIKLEVLGQEIRVRAGNDIIAQAKRYNGQDVWVVQAEILIRQHFKPGQPRFQF